VGGSGRVVLAMVMAVAVGVVGLGACGSDDGRALAPIPGKGTVAMPRRPVIVDPLPAGWSVREVKTSNALPTEMQTVYLGPGSTLEHGPALAIAALGTEFGEGLCAPGHESTDVRFDPKAHPALRYEGRNLISFNGERIAGSELWGFVLGRDLDEETVQRGAKGAEFPADGPARIAASALPAGFEQFARAPVTPNAAFGQVIELTGPDGQSFVEIGAYDGDAASDAVARFWADTVVRGRCDDRYSRSYATVDGTNVLMRGTAPTSIVQRITAALRSSDPAGLAKFSGSVAGAPASSFLSGCQDADPVIDGTRDGVRWIVGVDRTSGSSRLFCTAYVVNGHPESGVTSSSAGPVTASGPVAVLVSGGGTLSVGGVQLVGGTVPRSTSRVVITDGHDSTEATLVDTESTPGLRWFGGMLLSASKVAPGISSLTVTAYDASGTEIGRSQSPE
jgi:hypothetical protein